MVDLKVILCDLKPDLVQAWLAAFPPEHYPQVEVWQCSFDQLKAEMLVSPANSFGFMNGGIDGAYSAYLGQEMVDDLQGIIKEEWNGEIPVGCATHVLTGNEQFPVLISAPTMRVPAFIGGTNNVYMATRAALIVAKNLIYEGVVLLGSTILIPGMGTGVGGVTPEECAFQMRAAYNDIVLEMNEFPESLFDASVKHNLILQKD